MDVKSDNILLDDDFRAKIANFGLARSVEGGEGEGEQFPMTRHIVGTRGYMAPEYLENGLVSTKLDVYAFGVPIFEILVGKEVAAMYAEDNNNDKNVWEILSVVLSEEGERERLREFMDPSLQGNYPMEHVLFVAGIIGACMPKDPARCPAMCDIDCIISVQSLGIFVEVGITSVNFSGYWSLS